jgi:hypothetical protein
LFTRRAERLPVSGDDEGEEQAVECASDIVPATNRKATAAIRASLATSVGPGREAVSPSGS